jgi:TonB family protein
MERQLAVDPEDEEIRASLLRHYWQERLEDKRASLILWLIDHHPESTLHGRQTGHIFRNGPHGNPTVFEDAKSRWLAQVNQHPENATILGNAARVVNESSLTEGIALMKRAQTLDPAHRTRPLAWLYSLMLMESVNKPAPRDPEVLLQIKGELQASNDILLVGSVARTVARMSVPSPTGKNQLKAIATELIRHAEALDPQNREWPALLEGAQGLRDLSEQPPVSIESTPQLMHVSKAVAAGALLESETPEYPSEALAIHLHGNVLLKVRIGKDGRVTEATVLSGHPRLVQPAMEAVKRYVYKPFMLNGSAVDVSTVVEVTFREP